MKVAPARQRSSSRASEPRSPADRPDDRAVIAVAKRQPDLHACQSFPVAKKSLLRCPPPPRRPPRRSAARLCGLPGRYDECRAADGSLRPHWADFLRLLGGDAGAKFTPRSRRLRARDSRAGRQPERLRRRPLRTAALAARRGSRISSSAPGLGAARRRVCASARISTTRCSATSTATRKLFRSGSLPPELAMINPHFLRPCAGLGRTAACSSTLCAWTSRARPTASGGCCKTGSMRPPASATRCKTARSCAGRCRESYHARAGAEPAGFFPELSRARSLELAAGASPGGEEPRIVLLTPGPANETYFEHAYLARHFGYPLVEGADLTTRDRQVFLRTVGGLKRVDAILRRVDSAFLRSARTQPALAARRARARPRGARRPRRRSPISSAAPRSKARRCSRF